MRRIADRVRGLYTAPDLVAAGMWAWSAPAGTWVLVDVQSTVPGVVQARVDLWLMTDSAEQPVGRSDPMPAAAAIEAFAFEDLTGDGLPDLLGSVADSAGTSFVVFIPGARGAMAEAMESDAGGWRFDADTDSLPSPMVTGAGGACALRLWAREPAPDGRGEGWRWLAILPGGRLGLPSARAPVSC